MKLADYTNPSAALSRVVQRNREREAILCGDRRVTYIELADLAARYAALLASLGVAPGDRVAILSKNSIEFVAAIFGILRLGAVVTPLNWRLTAGEIDRVRIDAEPSACLMSAEFADLLSATGFDPGACACLDDPLPRLGDLPEPAPYEFRWDEPALQLYTSGTTGQAKGAVFNNGCLARFCDLHEPCYPAWFRSGSDVRYAVTTPLFHVGGLEMVLRTLFSDGCSILLREFNVENAVDAIVRLKANCIAMVPTALQMMLSSPAARSADLSGLTKFFYGAAPITPALLDQALAALPNCRFVQTFGMTEAMGSLLALPPEDHAAARRDKMRSVGKPLPHTEARVGDVAGHTLPPGVVGELLVRSPFLMAGYHKRDDVDLKTIDGEGWLHTGDAASIDEQGYFYLHDRMSDMIISGGENVYPGEVERVLLQHPAIGEAAVIGVPDAKWGERIQGVVVLRDGASFDEAEGIAWMRSSLAGYKVPKGITVVPALPTNAIGKVARRLVKAAWLSRAKDAEDG